MAAPPQVQRKRKRLDVEEAEESATKRPAPFGQLVGVSDASAGASSAVASTNGPELELSPPAQKGEEPKSIRQLLSDSKQTRPRRAKKDTARGHTPPSRDESDGDVRPPPSVAVLPPPASPRTSSTEQPLTTMYAPQYDFVNGKLQVRSDSVILDQAEDPNLNEATITHVEETAHTRRITSNSFAKRSSNLPWTSDEIDEFYRALRKCGTDFNMIATLLPGRDRNQIRRRFKKEEKDHPERIDFALTHSLPMSSEDTDQLKSAATAPKTSKDVMLEQNPQEADFHRDIVE